MKKLYKKDEVWFAILWIVIYCLVELIGGHLSRTIGIESFFTAILNLVLTMVLFVWIKQNDLLEKYGFCCTSVPAKKFFYYLPLIVISTVGLWNGVAINMSVFEMICYICSMACVGFLEEMIFRGFLFKAMSIDNPKNAMIVSSVTFGLGHFLNLMNGSGMDWIANLCQVCGAIAIGFLFVVIFYRSGSLLPCIFTHAAIDVMSVFANETGLTVEKRLMLSGIRLVIVLIYTFVLCKTLPQKKHE